MANKHHRRKSSRSSSFQIRWFDGRGDRLVEVRGEKKKASTITTLLALPWIDAKSIQVRRL